MPLAIALSLILFGCHAEPISNSQTNNPKIKVELLFEHEGCKVYRFEDGYYRYFSDCRGSIETQYAASCGKNCTKQVRYGTENMGRSVEEPYR